MAKRFASTWSKHFRAYAVLLMFGRRHCWPQDCATGREWIVGERGLWPIYQDGTFCFDTQVTRIVIDVGAYKKTEFLQHALDSQDIVVIAFEPLPQIAHDHETHSRLLLVPCAIGLHGGKAAFHVFPSDLAWSSLRPISTHANSSNGDLNIMPQTTYITVLTLEEVLKRVPSHLQIQIVKVDAQGSDLDVVMSAGTEVQRVHRFQVELQDLNPDHPGRLYQNQPVKHDFIKAFQDIGFLLERCWDNNPVYKEENCVFARQVSFVHVYSSCFLPSTGLFKPELLPQQHYWQEAFQGPFEIVRANKMKLMEFTYCVLAPRHFLNTTLSVDQCCLHAYLRAIDLRRDFSAFHPVKMISANVTYIMLRVSL